MKRLAVILACLALPLPAQEWDERDLPRHIRVIVEYIEAPHATVTAVMLSEHADSGPKLHARMRALVKARKARIMETTIVACRPGPRTTGS